MNNIVSLLIDILHPSHCISCGKSISFNQYNVCTDCLHSVSSITSPLNCQICDGMLMDKTCPFCSQREIYIDKNISLFEYSGSIKIMLQNLKFNHMKLLYKPICSRIGKELDRITIKPDIITYVPMNRRKKWKRGYNQAELFAKEIGKMMNIPLVSLLKEAKTSKKQSDLQYTDRFLHVIDRYSVKQSKDCKNKKILLVDDIFTTGATINECARLLKKNGAAYVFSLTVARSGKRLENY